MNEKLYNILNEVGFNDKEMKIIDGLQEFEGLIPTEFTDMYNGILGYFIQESYRKGKVKGIKEVEQIIKDNNLKADWLIGDESYRNFY